MQDIDPRRPEPGTAIVMASDPTGPKIPPGPDPQPVPPAPVEPPVPGPAGPRSPYPVNDPGIADPTQPGSEPDYVPPVPPGGPGQM